MPAPPGEVWPAVTQSDEVSAWFGADAQLDVRPGGRGVFRWPDGTERHVVVEDVEPPRRLSFRWLPFQRTAAGEIVTLPSTPRGDHPRRGARGHARARGGAAGVLAGATRRGSAGRVLAAIGREARPHRRHLHRARRRHPPAGHPRAVEQGPATATGLAAHAAGDAPGRHQAPERARRRRPRHGHAARPGEASTRSPPGRSPMRSRGWLTSAGDGTSGWPRCATTWPRLGATADGAQLARDRPASGRRRSAHSGCGRRGSTVGAAPVHERERRLGVVVRLEHGLDRGADVDRCCCGSPSRLPTIRTLSASGSSTSTTTYGPASFSAGCTGCQTAPSCRCGRGPRRAPTPGRTTGSDGRSTPGPTASRGSRGSAGCTARRAACPPSTAR